MFCCVFLQSSSNPSIYFLSKSFLPKIFHLAVETKQRIYKGTTRVANLGGRKGKNGWKRGPLHIQTSKFLSSFWRNRLFWYSQPIPKGEGDGTVRIDRLSLGQDMEQSHAGNDNASSVVGERGVGRVKKNGSAFGARNSKKMGWVKSENCKGLWAESIVQRKKMKWVWGFGFCWKRDRWKCFKGPKLLLEKSWIGNLI